MRTLRRVALATTVLGVLTLVAAIMWDGPSGSDTATAEAAWRLTGTNGDPDLSATETTERKPKKRSKPDSSPTGSASPSGETSPSGSATPSPSPSAGQSKTPPASSAPSSQPNSSSSPSKSTSPDEADIQRVLTLVNEERRKAKCGDVHLDGRLNNAAVEHSKDMANRKYFDHNTPEGKTPWDRAKAAGYQTPTGENIAMGYRTPEEVMKGWMNSEGHKANILNCGSKAMGVGLARNSSGTIYWTQLFGSV